MGPERLFGIATAQPDLSGVDQTGGLVALSFTKYKNDGINVYCQCDNDAGWVLKGRAKLSPYLDNRPLLETRRPELRIMKALTRVTLALATCVLASVAMAGDFTTYSIGNSLTQDLLYQVQGPIYTYENRLGNTYHWGIQFRPGATLTYLHDNPRDAGQPAITRSGIGYYASSPTSSGGWPSSNTQAWDVALTSAANTWDVVTMELYKSIPNTNRPYSYCTLGTDTTAMNDVITKTRASNATNNASTRFFLYAAWPDWSANIDVHDNAQYQTNFTATTTNNDSQLGRLSRDYYQNLYNRVHIANPGVSLSVIPVGEVYYKLSTMMDSNAFSGSGLTSIGQLYRDPFHANVLGRDIIAWTAFATLFKQSPLGLDRYSPYDTSATGTILLYKGADHGYRQFQTSSLTLSDKRLIQNTIWQVLSKNNAYTHVPIAPVGYWPLDELSGLAMDHSGNNNNGTLVNSPAPVQGMLGKALNFNRASRSYVGMNNASAIKGPLPITVSVWINPIPIIGANSVIFGSDNWNGSLYAGYSLTLTSDGHLQASFGSGTAGTSGRRTRTGGMVLTPGWQHVSAVIQGQGNVHLYINGIEDVGGGYSGTGGAMVYTTAMSKIGAGGNVYFNGAIDDVRVYNRALSNTEIHLLANPSGVIGLLMGMR